MKLRRIEESDFFSKPVWIWKLKKYLLITTCHFANDRHSKYFDNLNTVFSQKIQLNTVYDDENGNLEAQQDLLRSTSDGHAEQNARKRLGTSPFSALIC